MNERLDIKRIHRQVLAARGGSLVKATVLDYERITDQLAKVVVQLSTPCDRDEARAALNKALNGQASAVENTFLQVTSDAAIYSGLVAHNPEVKEFTKEAQASLEERKGALRVVAKNLLLDETDQSLWETRESAGGKFLVRTGKEDLSELLSSVAQLSPILETKEVMARTHAAVPTRNYVQFIDRDTAELGYGYVVAATDKTVMVVTSATDEPLEVPVVDVLQVADFEGEDSEHVPFEVPASSADSSKLRNYYQKVFKHAPFFLEKMNKVINDGAKF
jgi:voltage-gated potassium channel Kch